jgi:acyl-CoA thioesterase
MGDLENALEIRQIDPDQWTALADPKYESSNGMFGGWVMAVVLLALDDATDEAEPSAITMNFLEMLPPGSEVGIALHQVGGSRSIGHWLAEVTDIDHSRLVAFATAVFTKRRDTDGRLSVRMPKAPDPESLETFNPPGPQGQRCIHRAITGYPAFNRQDTLSTAWVKDLTGRAVDRAQLAFLADARAPRSFFWASGPRPSATVTMSVYFHGTPEELAAVGDDYVLSEAFGIHGAQSVSEEQLRLWSRRGALLASSQQLSWYR